MSATIEFEKKTKELIDSLKSICANYGLGNDGNEFKIITQVFLYKFLNDKFVYEIKQTDKKLAKLDPKELDVALQKLSADDYEMLSMQLNENTARLKPKQFISSLFAQQISPSLQNFLIKRCSTLPKRTATSFL
jgi:type I restriction enzyme M protein